MSHFEKVFKILVLVLTIGFFTACDNVRFSANKSKGTAFEVPATPVDDGGNTTGDDGETGGDDETGGDEGGQDDDGDDNNGGDDGNDDDDGDHNNGGDDDDDDDGDHNNGGDDDDDDHNNGGDHGNSDNDHDDDHGHHGNNDNDHDDDRGHHGNNNDKDHGGGSCNNGKHHDHDKDHHKYSTGCKGITVSKILVNVEAVYASPHGGENLLSKPVGQIDLLSGLPPFILDNINQDIDPNVLKIKLASDGNIIVDSDGNEHYLKTPSAQQSGLKLISFDISDEIFLAGESYVVKFDVDPMKQLVGNKRKCILKPVIRDTEIVNTRDEF